MDQVTVVEIQIEDAGRLLERLVQDGIPVSAACWLKTHDDGEWFLYIASPVVDKEGAFKAYRRVHTLARQMPHPFHVNLFDIKLISPTSPVAKAALDLQRRYRGRGVVHHSYGTRGVGDLGLEEAFIYPPVSAEASHTA